MSEKLTPEEVDALNEWIKVDKAQKVAKALKLRTGTVYAVANGDDSVRAGTIAIVRLGLQKRTTSAEKSP